MTIYVVQNGELDDDRVVYGFIAAFTTKRVADTIVRRLKKEDPYEYQYACVEKLDLYETEGRWKRGLAVKRTRYGK